MRGLLRAIRSSTVLGCGSLPRAGQYVRRSTTATPSASRTARSRSRGSSGSSRCCRTSRRCCRCRSLAGASSASRRRHPWPFFGSELIPGVEAGVAELDDDARLRDRARARAFLRALHAARLDRAAPARPERPRRHAERAGLAREELRRARAARPLGAPPQLRADPRGARACRRPRRRSVAHGDLHFRHLLVEGCAAAA